MAGRLSQMQTLPEPALPTVQWAFDALQSRRVTQQTVRAEVNARLVALGLPPVSRSALSRFAIGIASGRVTRPEPLAPPPEIN